MTMEDREQVDVLIPAYNEENNIADTIEGIAGIKEVRQIIVIDDKSSDRTVQVVKSLPHAICLVELEKNGGKGKAIKEGLKYVESEVIALLDGDLGKTSSELKRLIEPVLSNRADMTIARFGKAKKKGGFGLVKQLAKKGVYLYTKKSIDTTLSGQRVYRKSLVDSMTYIPDRFGIEVAMTVEALRGDTRYEEVEVEMTHAETGRDLRGFIHRGRQFWDILKTLVLIPFKR